MIEAQEITQETVKILAIPVGIGLLSSWSLTWIVKFVWRGTHSYAERLHKWEQIIIAATIASFASVLALWVLSDLLTQKTGIALSSLKPYIGYFVFTGPLSPFLFAVLLWVVKVELDLKIYKKPAWHGLYNILNVAHKDNIDYNDGSSDLTKVIPVYEQNGVDFDPTSEDKTPTPKI